MKEKKWFFGTIICVVICLGLFAAVIVVTDPYFHFHAPLQWLSYDMSDERYANDGISRHFEYDAIITGSSMMQNFKTSEFDELFVCNAIKLPYAGAVYQEISQSLQRAFSYQEGIKAVVWGLDGSGLIKEANYQSYENFPTYLYDANPFNDIYYVLNKDVMCHRTLHNLLMTMTGTPSTTFDEYSSRDYENGYAAVMRNYDRREDILADTGLTEEERRMVEENIRENVCAVIEQNPDTTFYIFFTPYSVVYWDGWYRNGRISAQIEAEELAAGLLLQYDNVELYCFYENEDLIFNLNYYRDPIHYISEINSEILRWMQEGEYCLTKENYQEHAKRERELYLGYDYDALFPNH